MDVTDNDGHWTLEPGLAGAEGSPEDWVMVPEVAHVLAVQTQSEIVIDSGADISVAPLRLAGLGTSSRRSGVIMQDAQGNRIPEMQSRILDLEVATCDNQVVTIREKFCIAPIENVILSLGRLLRWGWTLGTHEGRPTLKKGDHKVPIRLRRNTLTIMAMVASISLSEPVRAENRRPGAAPQTRGVNMMSFDDLGPLPKGAAELACSPGWHILPSGLPFLVCHKVDELSLEQSLWNDGDWAWLAVFVLQLEQTRQAATTGRRCLDAGADGPCDGARRWPQEAC